MHLRFLRILVHFAFPCLLEFLPFATPAAQLQLRSVAVPLIASTPTLDDFKDMAPRGAAGRLLKVSGFLQQEPHDGAPATQRTDVYLGYDHAHLYIVWICFDHEPTRIRAHLGRREDIYDDDFVEVTLDTFTDRRHGFVFASNPLGVQADGLWTDGGDGPDNSWDTVWHSQGIITPSGFVVLEAIPFRSLRFPPASPGGWGVTFYRWIARESESDYWPRVSSRISGRLNQEGTLNGIEGVSPGRNLQFTPYFYGRSFRAIDVHDLQNASFDSKSASLKAGLDAKAIFHDSLTLDLTLNPDFSQIESDQPQSTVNQRFEVVYPEKRPFFLENANYFLTEGGGRFGGTPLVFTRRIADPEMGVRLTGTEGPWKIGLMFADDRSPGEVVPHDSPLHGKRAYFAIGRVAYDFGSQSSVGLIYTDREFLGEFNRAGGIDLNLRLAKNWTSTLRSAVSSTNDAVAGHLFGSDQEFELNGEGRRFAFYLQAREVTPGFRALSGYVYRVDIRRLNGYYHFSFHPGGGGPLLSWGPEFSGEVEVDHAGTLVHNDYRAGLALSLKRNTSITLATGVLGDVLRPQDFPSLPAKRKFGQYFVEAGIKSSPFRALTISSQFRRGGVIDLVVPNGQLPREADETSLNQTITWRPVSRLQIANSYLLDRVAINPLGHSVFNYHILRSNWNLQWNRSLSFRVITQFNNLLANSNFSSLTAARSLNFDFLLSYLVHPGTALYFGYNSNLAYIDAGLCARAAFTGACIPGSGGLSPTSSRLINDSRQIFFKFSYLIQR